MDDLYFPNMFLLTPCLNVKHFSKIAENKLSKQYWRTIFQSHWPKLWFMSSKTFPWFLLHSVKPWYKEFIDNEQHEPNSYHWFSGILGFYGMEDSIFYFYWKFCASNIFSRIALVTHNSKKKHLISMISFTLTRISYLWISSHFG